MAESIPLPTEEDTELLDMNATPAESLELTLAPVVDDTLMTDETGRPRFAPASAKTSVYRPEERKIRIPPHRMTPLKNRWPKAWSCAAPHEHH